MEQDLFSSIVEISPNFIAVVQNEKFVYVNSIGQSLLNCSNPRDIIGRYIYEFLHPDICVVIKDLLKNEIYNNANDPLKIEMIATNGNSIYLETSKTPLIYNKNKALLFIGRDITNTQPASDSLSSKKRLLSGKKRIEILVENSPVGVILIDGRVPTFINKALFKLLGLRSMEEFLKTNLFDLIHPDDRNPVKKLLKRVFDDDVNKPSYYQLTVRSCGINGPAKVLDLRFAAFRIAGKTELQVMVIDITDEIEKEKMINQLASDSLYVSQHNIVIANIKKELEDILQNKSRNYPIENYFHNIQKLLEAFPEHENDWGLFNQHFENLHPGFISNLKIICPSLTINEIKHCACIRLNADTKETARFFNVTPASIQKSRVRLKKKLNLPIDVDLHEFIENV